MFGGQDTTAAMQQSDGTLKGVNDLVGGTSIPVSTPGSIQSGTFGSVPSSTTPDPSSVGSAPALPDDASQRGSTGGSNELFDLKKQALQQLTPLINHLDQTPLERFRTLMMLIQASDNQTLLKDAYEAAQKIEDDKIRAQALLDIINEINYFTQQQNQGQ
ncbi:hypothetical protein IRY61_02205 [Candidatus Saccharibacteria bacterium]|nr:hypothetical protein [Candidatus Saccharibacteria bacterium]